MELQDKPPVVARKLVETLFRQPETLILSALICCGFGVVSYFGTGSRWYLAGAAYTVVVAIWRIRQSVAFARVGAEFSPTRWAFRNLLSGWATAADWALWTIAIPCEPDPMIGSMVLGLHAGLVGGSANRNHGVKAVAVGQILIAGVPLFAACLLANSPYLQFYAAVVVIYVAAALAATRFAHAQTLELLLCREQALVTAGKLALVNECLAEQAAIDPLTALLNRRALDLALAREWRIAAREEGAISVLMIDIDYFKLFNDHYGHQAGDDCLRTVASVLEAVIQRHRDIVARYGGEEFIIVLPVTTLDGATTLAASILAELSSRVLAHAASPFGRVTASIGVACQIGSTGKSLPDLINRADRALYSAIRNGRNQLCADLDTHQVRFQKSPPEPALTSP